MPPASVGSTIEVRSVKPVAVDAMGGDQAPAEIVAGARQAADELGIAVVLVGPPDARRRHRRPRAPRRLRGHRDGRRPGPGRAPQEGLVAGAGRRGGPRRQGLGHGLAPATPAPRWPAPCCAWAASRAWPARHRHADPGARHAPRPSCSTPAPTPSAARVAGAVRPDGLASSPARRVRRSPTPRVGLLSIGEEPTQGRPAGQGDPRAAGRSTAPGIDFIGNVEGRDLMTDARRRGRHRRLHRQRRPQDARGRHAARASAPSSSAFDRHARAARPPPRSLLPALAPSGRRARPRDLRRGHAPRRRRRLHHQPRLVVGRGPS